MAHWRERGFNLKTIGSVPSEDGLCGLVILRKYGKKYEKASLKIYMKRFHTNYANASIVRNFKILLYSSRCNLGTYLAKRFVELDEHHLLIGICCKSILNISYGQSSHLLCFTHPSLGLVMVLQPFL